MMKGIDVSDNQGSIDWAKVKADGVEFAILRTTRRSGNPDTYLPTNIKGCIENNLLFDFYKYSYAVTTAEANAEATKVVEVLKGYGVAPNRDTVVYIDVEDKIQFALSTSALTDIIKAFKAVIEDSGYSFGLYMGKYYYESGEVDLSQLNDLTWIARYYNGYNAMNFSDNPNEKYKPTVKSGELRGWQYTSSGKVNGINGNVDLDIYYGEIKPTVIEPEYYQTPEFTLIDSLNKIGVNSSFATRKQIALANGISDYKGTAEQNIQLLALLNSGKMIKA
jgi:GH25 family lysozyme M1 (1,4-beta-N-acetylmuramidase)